ncbi:MAG TPA: cytochrome P450, partial [Thermoanaerobaculia bacterium]|nr:cytochrome P450 [Thermoanaerobaculia bacterium]
GAAAASLIYELTRHPDWAARLEAELGEISLAELCAAPTRAAPAAHRFVKEVLRMWPSTPLVNRAVRTEIQHAGTCLRPGQGYLLSPDILHHDPRLWKDPDRFDPDRWLSAGDGGDTGPCPAGSYVPFGWAPRTCIGAGLGTGQLILLCWLLSTRYRIRLEEPAAVRMALFSVPLPRGLRGTIERR